MPCLIRAHPLYVREGLEQALLRVKPLNVLIPLEHSSRLLAPRIKAVRDASSGRSSASLDPCSYVREGLEPHSMKPLTFRYVLIPCMSGKVWNCPPLFPFGIQGFARSTPNFLLLAKARCILINFSVNCVTLFDLLKSRWQLRQQHRTQLVHNKLPDEYNPIFQSFAIWCTQNIRLYLGRTDRSKLRI